MPPLTELLFSFKGRIRRLHFWVAGLAAGAVAGGAMSILEFVAQSTGNFVIDPETQQVEATGPFAFAIGAIVLANMWINFALSVKRLHDRDRTGWWLLWQMLALVLGVITLAVAAVLPQEEATAGYAVAGYIVAGVFSLVAVAISVWLLVEIGFLRGTQGPNRFGADPLGATQADASI